MTYPQIKTPQAKVNPVMIATRLTFNPLAAEGLLVVGAGGALLVPEGVEPDVVGLCPLGELLSSSFKTLMVNPVITLPCTSLTT